MYTNSYVGKIKCIKDLANVVSYICEKQVGQKYDNDGY